MNTIKRSYRPAASGPASNKGLLSFLLLLLLAGWSNIVSAQKIATGGSHSLFLKNDGTVWTCGGNASGQLGDGTTTDRSTSVQVGGLTGITGIAAGNTHSLFLKNDGTVWTCGLNTNGQLGDGTTTNRSTPVQVSGLTGIIAIAGGGSHSLFLKNDGTVWACGDNGSGQLGDGTTTQRTTAVQVNGLTGITAIAAGYNHTLFLKSNGTAWTCGDNVYGQLGDGTTMPRSTPVQVNGLASVTAITGGGIHSLFLKSDGTAWACGFNNYGALGDGTTTNRSTAVQVSGLTNIAIITAGDGHSLFLKNNGTVWGCGYNGNGQLGDGTTISRSTTVQVSGLTGITAIAAHTIGNHSLFLKNDGTVWGCGSNSSGQVGDGTTTQRNAAVQVTILSNLAGFIAIAGKGNHSLFLKSDGTVWACGDNSDGQLGDGTATNRQTATQVSGLTDIIAIAVGVVHSLFLKSDGTVWSCGSNGYGQLGDGTTTNRLTAVQVSGLTGIIAIAGGSVHSLFVKSDGTVWACGSNYNGQLGDGTTTNRLTAVQVSGLTGITAIDGGYYHSLFLKNNGTAWACGYNNEGGLGDGTTTDRSTAVQVSGLTNITAIKAGYNYSLFLKNDGTVRACGSNGYGQLGDGTTTNRLNVVQVSGLTGISAITGEGFHSLFLKNDGTARACGFNNYGELGDGTTVQRMTTVQTAGLTGVTAIASGDFHSLFLKGDGTIWACGNNTQGELGDGTTTSRGTIEASVVMGWLNLGAAPTTVWYSKSTGNLNDLTTWGANTDGTGTSPTNFTTGGMTYNIVNNLAPTIGAAWAPVGTINVGDGVAAVNFTIPAGFAYTGDAINVLANSRLTITNTNIPTLGTLDATSTVVYNGASQTATATTYGNIAFSGSGTVMMAGSTTAQGGFSITAGTVKAPAGILRVAGNWSNSGTFAHNSGTVMLNGGGLQTISGSSSNTFNNLTISNAAGVTLSNNNTVDGDLNFAAGSLALGNTSLTLNGTVTGMSATSNFRSSGFASIYIGGSASTFGTIYFDQATDRTTNQLYDFTVQSGGTVNMGNKLVLFNALTISSSKLVMNGQTLTLLGTTALPAGGSSSGIVADAAATLELEGSGLGGNLAFSTTGNNIGTFSMNMSSSGSRVKIGSSFTCSNTFILRRGSIDLEGQMLTLNGNFSSTSSGQFSAQDGFPGDILIGGSGTLGTFYFSQNFDGTTNALRFFTLNRAGSIFTLGSKMVSTGNMVLSDGKVALNGNNLTLEGGFTGSDENSLTCDASASVTIGGSGALGALSFDQTTEGVTNTLSSLAMNRISSGTANLGNHLHINNALILTAGKLILGSSNLTIGATATVPVPSSSANMVVTNAAGQMRKKMTANGSFTFPIGDGTNYTPISISITAAAYNSNAYVGANVWEYKLPFNVNATDYLRRYWIIGLTGITSPSVNVIATYVSADIIGDESNIKSAKHASSWVKYFPLNSAAKSLTASAITDESFEVTGITRADLSVSSPASVIIAVPGSALLTATVTNGDAPFTYTWAPANGLSATTGVSVTASPTVTTTYTVTVRDGNGFTASASTLVTANMPPADITGNMGVCAGVSTDLSDATSGGNWSTPNTTIAMVDANGTVTGVTAGTAVISYTTTGGTTTATVTVNAVPAFTARSNNGPVCEGASLNLTSSATGGTGTLNYEWSGPSSFAASGQNASVPVATLAATGAYTVIVTDDNGCADTTSTTAIVNSAPGAISGNTTVMAGATTTLSNAVAGGVWSSASTSVATVNSSMGVVTGVTAGTAVINYTIGGSCSATTTVTVNAATTSNIVCVGQTTILDNGGVPGGTWSSNNGSIATVVTATGRVTGVNQGTVIMNYFRPSGGIMTTTVTVKPLSQTTGLTTVCAGKSMMLTNTSAGPGMWASSDEDIALVSAAGAVSGVTAGVVAISFTAANGCVATKTITVNPSAQISGITNVCTGKTTNLSNSIGGGIWSSGTGAQATVSAAGTVYGVASGAPRINYILPTGCQSTVTVTVNPLVAITPSTATVVCQGQSVLLANTVSGGVWSSDNSAIATVNTSGSVSGAGSGSTLVSYTTAAGCVATKAVTVNPKATVTGSMLVCVGQLTSLSNSIGGGTWSSSSLAYASVSPAGVVTGVAAGNALIKYNMPGGCNSTATVAVGALSPITITSGAGCQGQTIILANATPGGGVWSSSNTMVATVNTSGAVTGITNGSVSIYFTTPAGCIATKTVSIAATSPITGSLTVCVGQSTNVSNSLVGGVWSTSSGSLAQVSTSGVVTGVAAGTPKLFYIWPNGCQETATVTVRALSPATGGTNAICASSSMTLANATPFGGVWSSSNTSAATVSATGFVKGTGAGVTLISFTTNTDGCVATRTVTVNACRQADTTETTAVTIMAAQSDVHLFPNPNKGVFRLKGTIGSADDTNIEVTIVNMLGQVVYNKNVTVHDGRIEEQISLNGNMAAGMYILHLRMESGSRLFHFVVSE